MDRKTREDVTTRILNDEMSDEEATEILLGEFRAACRLADVPNPPPDIELECARSIMSLTGKIGAHAALQGEKDGSVVAMAVAIKTMFLRSTDPTAIPVADALDFGDDTLH